MSRARADFTMNQRQYEDARLHGPAMRVRDPTLVDPFVGEVLAQPQTATPRYRSRT